MAQTQNQQPPPESRPAEQTAPAQAPGRAGRIKGRITTDGRPVAEASVLAFPVNFTSNLEGAVTSLFRPVMSDADGRFELTGLRGSGIALKKGGCYGIRIEDNRVQLEWLLPPRVLRAED